MHDPCCKDDTNMSLKPFLCSMLVDEPAKTKLTDLSAQNEKCNKKRVARLSCGEFVGVGSRGLIVSQDLQEFSNRSSSFVVFISKVRRFFNQLILFKQHGAMISGFLLRPWQNVPCRRWEEPPLKLLTSTFWGLPPNVGKPRISQPNS